MHFPQIPSQSENARGLYTSDIDALVGFHNNRNRRYIQLQEGKLQAKIKEVSLDKVNLFKESLNVGCSIEAAPAEFILPFGYILPSSSSYRFCGVEASTGTFVQASGGAWEVNFKDKIDFVGSAFNKEYFFKSYELVVGRPVPEQHLISRIAPSSDHQGILYAQAINTVLTWLHANPQVFQHTAVIQLLCSQIFKLTLEALPRFELDLPLKNQPKRVKGVRRVIDYLQAHAHELPDIQMLCKVGGVSERSLQYGFLDHLGITPIQYLRMVRLNGARTDLSRENTKNTRVADVAISWGFLEFGRFSKEYKKLFQELPSETLRRDR